MGADTSVHIAEPELRRLEAGINELIRSRLLLEEENAALRQQHTLLLAERAGLVEKNRQAQGRVEQIIQRLSALEEEL